MSCRMAMLRMAEDGLITLPPPRRKPPPPQVISFTAQTDSRPELTRPVHALNPVQLRLVEPEQSRLWNE